MNELELSYHIIVWMFNDRREETEKENFSFIVLVEVNGITKNFKFIVPKRIFETQIHQCIQI